MALLFRKLLRERKGEKLKVYKALTVEGRSQYQNFQWPLPEEWSDTPGEWVKVAGPTSLCRSGLHGYLTLDIAKKSAPGYDIYEMEIQGDIKKDGSKACGLKGRLIKLVWTQDGQARRALQDFVWQ